MVAPFGGMPSRNPVGFVEKNIVQLRIILNKYKDELFRSR